MPYQPDPALVRTIAERVITSEIGEIRDLSRVDIREMCEDEVADIEVDYRATVEEVQDAEDALIDAIRADIKAAVLFPSWGASGADDALNSAYTERTNLVALLAAIYPSGWDYADPACPDWPVVFIDLPTGQASWHISREDWWICACIPRRHGAEWDGHTTAQKYQRIRDLIAAIDKGDERNLRGASRRMSEPTATPTTAPLIHFAADRGAACGVRFTPNGTVYTYAYDEDDPDINCRDCRLYLKGLADGRRERV